jgi:tetratricopeptide (TPR) repeat protein
VDDELSSPREREYLTLARVLITQQRPDEALPLLGRLLHLAESQGRMGNALEMLVLQAVAQQASGDEARALERLSRALSFAEPEGYIRLFVDEGTPMAQLLVQMLLYLGLLWAVVLVVVVAYGPGRFMRRRASDHLQEAVAGPKADAAFPPDGHVL